MVNQRRGVRIAGSLVRPTRTGISEFTKSLTAPYIADRLRREEDVRGSAGGGRG
jgi:hypothetical protein